MNKKELVSKVTDVLRENDIRKKVQAQKTVFHISDDSGNQSDFIVRKPKKGLLFTNEDVAEILNACLAVMQDAMAKGECISLAGFGSLFMHYREARTNKHPATGERVAVPARYVPKFKPSKRLKAATKVFESTVFDKQFKDSLSPHYEDEDAEVDD